MNIEQQLYNLKMKVLTLDDIPEHLKEVLANDIHLIESNMKAKNNDVLDPVIYSDPNCMVQDIKTGKILKPYGTTIQNT